MEADRWTQIERLFERARDLSPERRSAFLQDHCDDPAVRGEVASLLAAREDAPGFFAAAAREVVAPMRDALDESTAEAAAPDLSGQTIGGYRLLDEIGVGGMSVVYRAERVGADFDQTVAVKLLRRRLHATEAADRFRAERQMLARLDHPDVAQLIDGGVTEDGQPYLVMEYVEGRPITTYADANELGLEARLDLLDQVCGVVEAAHRQLVVHRDLKPSNVLVVETEEGPRVKLLDFGIAKLLDDSVPVTRLRTRTGQHLMTPAYAAPEQVTGDEITTATDVYQLGVLAYELLAGRRPFDLTGKSLTEIERALQDETPERPSTVAATSAEQLRGDLDTILLKTLRKEPERRYQSVEALAADLQRYRQGEPVEARPATLGYRAKKFVNRNRTAVGAGVLIVLLGVAYAVTVTIQANRLAEQRDRAQREAETAKQVSSYLAGLFRASDPYQTPDTVTARTLLRRGTQRASRLQGQPAVRAQMLVAIARAHWGLGNYGVADSLLRGARALQERLYDGPHPDLAATLHVLGAIQSERGNHGEAESLSKKSLAMDRQLYEAPHPEIAEGLYYVAWAREEQGELAPAGSLYREALAIRRAVRDTPEIERAAILNNLGLVLENQGRYAEADSMYRRALSIKRKRLQPGHPSTATSLNNLGVVLKENGEYTAADSVYREVLDIKRAQLGPQHPKVATTLSNLGTVLVEQGRYERADSMYRQELWIERRAFGPNHLKTAKTLDELATLQKKRGRYAAAESTYRKVLAIERDTLGRKHLDVAGTLNDLAIVLRMRDRPIAADSMYREALAIERTQLGPQHPRIATALNNLAVARWDRGDYVGADSLYREALAIRKKKLGPEHPRTATTMHNWAYTLKALDRYTAADSLFHRALALRRQAQGDTHLHVADSHVGLALLRREQGDYEAAEHHFRRALSIRHANLPENHPEVRKVTRRLADLYEQWGRPEQARQYRVAASKSETER